MKNLCDFLLLCCFSTTPNDTTSMTTPTMWCHVKSWMLRSFTGSKKRNCDFTLEVLLTLLEIYEETELFVYSFAAQCTLYFAKYWQRGRLDTKRAPIKACENVDVPPFGSCILQCWKDISPPVRWRTSNSNEFYSAEKRVSPFSWDSALSPFPASVAGLGMLVVLSRLPYFH